MPTKLQLPPHGTRWKWGDARVSIDTVSIDIYWLNDMDDYDDKEIDDPHIVLPVLERLWRDEVEKFESGGYKQYGSEKLKARFGRMFPYNYACDQLHAVEAAWAALREES